MIVPKAGKVLCVGRLYCDLVFSGTPKMPVVGEEVFAKKLSTHAGGGAFITAAYLVSADQKVSLCSTIPSGPFGEVIEAEIQKSGIDSSQCLKASAEMSPQVTVAIPSSNDRAFLTNRSGLAIPNTITAAMDDSELSHLHIAELATLSEFPKLTQMAKDRGLTISLDCSWDEGLIYEPTSRELLKGIDVFLPNEKELRALFCIKDEVANHQHEILRHAPVVVVKRGKNGADLITEASMITDAAIPCEVKDTIGAGDAFNAGFIFSWINGRPLYECLRAGNLNGAEAIKHIGGQRSAENLSQPLISEFSA
jgi:sugar/nucleoside kinase (ribokinase family)